MDSNELLRSHHELRVALIIADLRLRELNCGQSDWVQPILVRVLENARSVTAGRTSPRRRLDREK